MGLMFGIKTFVGIKTFNRYGKRALFVPINAVWDAIQLQDDSLVVLGMREERTWLLKTDSKGNIAWIPSFQSDFGRGFALLQMADDGILIAGEKDVGQKQKDGVLIKTDSAGIFEWLKTYGGSRSDGFTAMEQRRNGEVTVMGWTESFEFEARTRLWLLGIDSTIIK